MSAVLEILSETILHCQEGGSDKLYRVRVEGDGQTFSVFCANCRRGNPWVDQGAKAKDVSQAQAEKKAQSVINEKMKKGYHIVETRTGQGEAAATHSLVGVEAPVRTGMRPQLLVPVSEEEAIRLATDPRYIAQEKFDGRRHQVRREGGAVDASNKLGIAVTPDEKVIAALPEADFEVDGELVGETLHLFDIMSLHGCDLRSQPYRVRYEALTRFMGEVRGPNVVLVECATDKVSFLEALRKRGAEGIVFKDLEAPYQEGRVKTQFKFKFVSTASFIVAKVNEKRSVAIMLLDGDTIVPVGNVTIPANKDIPEAGAVVEVAYLYAFRGGSIFQPTYQGERDDILPAECQLAQLRYKGEGVDDEDEA